MNFAFAYIDPESYQVVTMDSDTPFSLFSDATNLKSIKQDLKVFVSVGGWTFSDNGTATQPVFGKIAASATNRQTFADNAVHFMKQYGMEPITPSSDTQSFNVVLFQGLMALISIGNTQVLATKAAAPKTLQTTSCFSRPYARLLTPVEATSDSPSRLPHHTGISAGLISPA